MRDFELHFLTIGRGLGEVENSDAILGNLRRVSHTKTGHEILQHLVDHGQPGVESGNFFKALQSGRRLANLISINREFEVREWIALSDTALFIAQITFFFER
jgi:hypothetical protein